MAVEVCNPATGGQQCIQSGLTTPSVSGCVAQVNANQPAMRAARVLQSSRREVKDRKEKERLAARAFKVRQHSCSSQPPTSAVQLYDQRQLHW